MSFLNSVIIFEMSHLPNVAPQMHLKRQTNRAQVFRLISTEKFARKLAGGGPHRRDFLNRG